MEVVFKALCYFFSLFLLPANHSGLLNTRLKCGRRLDVLCLCLCGVGRSTLAFLRGVVQGTDALQFMILQAATFSFLQFNIPVVNTSLREGIDAT